MKKRMLSFILALMMCSSFAIPAFAADATVYDCEWFAIDHVTEVEETSGMGDYRAYVTATAPVTVTIVKSADFSLEENKIWYFTDMRIVEGSNWNDEVSLDDYTGVKYIEKGDFESYFPGSYFVISEPGTYSLFASGNVIKNGKYYTFWGSSGAYLIVSPAPAPEPAKPVVQPTTQNLTVNGEKKDTEIYNIDGSNFFKLRDMAALLNGTGSQFSVDWDDASSTIAIQKGKAYSPVGGELVTGTDKSASAVVSAQKLTINGEAVELTAYNIGGNNFFKLRDLGSALGFDVDYDSTTATMLVKSR